MNTNRTTWIVAIITGVVCLGVGLTSGWFGHRAYMINELESAFEGAGEDVDGDTEEADAEEADTEPAGPPEADSPDDGLFSYEVTGTERTDTYKDEDCGETYQPDGGEFLVVTLSAENVGDSASMPAVDPGEVTGYTEDGKAFETHTGICSFADETNPGNSTEYEVVFDAPKDTEFTVMELSAWEAPDVAVIEAKKA
ncbi:DUF4352 domain-containing protein [Halostreptopolyspora alba]|uniref:DUF4352 domain-containing protein n=1 Tax=Halostreptopolyspora alba TaxID=2487137 RepID=A0A3N0E1V8_9ACTN|nr:DUF4352 domain-containing protein [Nocardiopsaceae bacterium YIM 96095]